MQFNENFMMCNLYERFHNESRYHVSGLNSTGTISYSLRTI